MIRDHVVFFRGLGGNSLLYGGLLSLSKGSRLHPGELSGRFLDGLGKPPDQPPDRKEMDCRDQDESPAEAGFLAR